MKRLLLCILFLAAMLVLCAGASADTAPVFSQQEYTFEGYVCPETETSFSRLIGGAVYIQNYNELRETLNGDPEWTMELADGEDIHAIADNHDLYAVWFRTPDGYVPDHPAQATYRAVCTWDGNTTELTIRFIIKEFDMGLPEGIDLSDEINTQVGEDVTVTAGILPSGWMQEGVDPSFQLSTNNDFWTEDVEARTDYSRTLHMDEAGQYNVYAYIYLENVILMKEIRFNVLDENGELPGLKIDLDFNSWNGRDSTVYYLGVDEGLGEIESDTLQQDPFITQYWLGNREECSTNLSGTPVFSWTYEGSAVFDFEPYERHDSAHINVYLKEMPASPETDIIHLACEWDGNVWEQDYTVTFAEAPGDLPTGVVLPFEEPLTFAAGTEFCPMDMISFSSGWQSQEDDFWNVELTYINSSGYERDWEYSRYDNEQRKGYYTLTRYGEYTGILTVQSGRVVWRHEFPVRVTDENGEIPAPGMNVATENTDTWHYYLNDLQNGIEDEMGRYSQDDMIAQFYIVDDDYERIKDTTDEEPVWNLEIISGDADLHLYSYEWWENRYVNLVVGTRPAQPGTTEFMLTCDWAGYHFEKLLTFVALELPDGLPEGIALDFGDTWTVKAGEYLDADFRNHVSFANGWSIAGEERYCGYNFGGADWSDGPAGMCFRTPGVYNANVYLAYCNIFCHKSFTLIVTDENGNIPEPTMHVNWSTSTGTDAIHYYLNDLTQNPDEQGRYSEDGGIVQFYINEDDYQRIRATTNEEPVWSYTILSGDVKLRLNPFEWNPEVCNVDLAARPTQPGTTEFMMYCDWAGYHYEEKMSIIIMELPDGLPEGIVLDFGDTWTVKAGEAQSIFDHAAFINDWSLDGEVLFFGFSFEDADYNFVQNGVRFNTPGIYTGMFVLNYVNIHCQKSFTLIVTDENGNIPDPELHIYTGNTDTYNYYLNDLPETADEKGRFSRDSMVAQFRINYDDYDRICQETDDDPQWSLEILSGDPDLLQLDTNLWTTQYCNLRIKNKPAQPGTTEFMLRCEWDGLTFEKQLSVDVKEIPGGLPEGIVLDFGDTWIVMAGEVLPFSFDQHASFIDNWSIEGERQTYGYSFGMASWNSNNNGIFFTTPGVYENAFIELNYANIVCRKYFTLIVLDENSTGTMVLMLPQGLVTIEESAFEGVPAEIVILPDGCQSIGSGAFRNCTNLKAVYIPASVTDIADDAFEGCGTIYYLGAKP